MSVWNEERYLPEAIQSVLNQSYENFEFIIIDDGSTDQSWNLIERFQLVDKRIRAIRQKNVGLTRALNRGISECNGNYLARMDADDVCAIDRFKNQIAFLALRPEVVATGGQIELIDQDGTSIGERRLETTHEAIVGQLLKGNGSAISHPALMCRLSAIRSINGYRERFKTAQDLDLYLRLASIGKLANTSELALYYRRHMGAVGARSPLRQYTDVMSILKQTYKQRNESVPTEVIDSWRAGAFQNQFKKTATAIQGGQSYQGAREAIIGLLASRQLRFARLLGSAFKQLLLSCRFR